MIMMMIMMRIIIMMVFHSISIQLIHSTRHRQRTAIAIYPSIDDTNRLHLQLKNMQISS